MRDSNPERARTVKQNSPVDCFVGEWCEVRYQNAKHLGGRAGQMRSICIVPEDPPRVAVYLYAAPKSLEKSRLFAFLSLFFKLQFYRCQRPTRWIRTFEVKIMGRFSDSLSLNLPFFIYTIVFWRNTELLFIRTVKGAVLPIPTFFAHGFWLPTACKHIFANNQPFCNDIIPNG